ncbi:uncharacterized protein LOC132796494 isoform X3 [Drosophila nasuta]|uniref:uncharacterized protein LOC132796494 isoform X3 n=1 Tax=Drosophila nasuta TaxID=42062 RepID=UPI00295F3327|nr:uncharacterized protein LOC132796494 isoform X3 [Drosophila nasuta]
MECGRCPPSWSLLQARTISWQQTVEALLDSGSNVSRCVASRRVESSRVGWLDKSRAKSRLT